MLGQLALERPPADAKLRQRVQLVLVSPGEANRILIREHYLHRARNMAQLAYGVLLSGEVIGFILFSYVQYAHHRKSIHGYGTMETLELARLWLRDNIPHLASCSVGQALRRIKRDWQTKYPHLPEPKAIVAWADLTHHEGTVYKAANFQDMGVTRGQMHAYRNRRVYPDYQHHKRRFLYPLKD